MNARNTYSVWTRLRCGGRFGGKLICGHLIANRNVCPAPLVGRNAFRSFDPLVLSSSGYPFLAGALPFDGAASQRISWIVNSWISRALSGAPVDCFVVPLKVIPILDISSVRLRSKMTRPFISFLLLHGVVYPVWRCLVRKQHPLSLRDTRFGNPLVARRSCAVFPFSSSFSSTVAVCWVDYADDK